MSRRKDEPSLDASAKAVPKNIAYPKYMTRQQPPYRPHVMRVAVDRYFKQQYHDLEVERIWKKTWQWACREEEIPEIGDYHIYEIAELSFIVIRTGENEFKAYWNSCLHRGRKICEHNGKRAQELRCMFHGWAWNIDGTMKDMTCGWDFPGTRDEVTRLPEARTGAWGGFVFINPDLDCEPLETFLGPDLPEHFEHAGHDYAKKWKQVHTVADLACNWKIAQEAFIENWHVLYTHPQQVRAPGDRAVLGIRWDDYGNWMRSNPALPTDPYKTPGGWATTAETDQQLIDAHYEYHLNQDRPIQQPPGETATQTILREGRDFMRGVLGDKIDDYHDAHLFGGEMVHIWPNFHPWGGLSRLVYRFRPYKSDPNRCLMDVCLIGPWPDDRPRPPPAPPHRLRQDQTIADAPELGQVGRIFQQDINNMLNVHEGMKTSRQGYVILSQHNEAPVRHLHDLYNKSMGFEDGDYLAEER
jgi:phenylpropionate dioxygenase-like ring-hydroxylating dioxygenase large terminal subunit